MHLIQWNYTKEEWKRFRYWKSRQKGILFGFIEKIWPFTTHNVPEIRITTDRVVINNTHQPFSNQDRRLQTISVRESGQVNLLEISYEQGKRKRNISIPVPKGKLKEAFHLQARLSEK